MRDVDSVKTLGHCTLCDQRVFREGEFVGSLGHPMPGARRVTFVLMDGSRADVTFCADCDICPEDLPVIHKKIREAGSRESKSESRTAHGAKPLSLRQQWLHGRLHLEQVDNVPLGVLYEETWEQAIEREMKHGST